MNGKDLKNAGMQLALFNADDWVDTAISRLKEFCVKRKQANPEFLFEDFRLHVEALGDTPPTSHKIWGCIPRIAMKQGLIAWTGEHVPAQSAKTHRHYVKRWRAL